LLFALCNELNKAVVVFGRDHFTMLVGMSLTRSLSMLAVISSLGLPLEDSLTLTPPAGCREEIIAGQDAYGFSGVCCKA